MQGCTQNIGEMKMAKNTPTKVGNDATGWRRGERGYGKDGFAHEFRRPDFDREKQQGPLAVGMETYVGGAPQLEGDDIE
jgi:hypothetical protein